MGFEPGSTTIKGTSRLTYPLDHGSTAHYNQQLSHTSKHSKNNIFDIIIFERFKKQPTRSSNVANPLNLVSYFESLSFNFAVLVFNMAFYVISGKTLKSSA